MASRVAKRLNIDSKRIVGALTLIEVEGHVQFIVQSAIDEHGAGLSAKHLEPHRLVEANGRGISRIDRQVHLEQSGHQASESERLGEERAAHALAPGLGTDIHAPDDRLVIQLSLALSAKADDADKCHVLERAEDSTIARSLQLFLGNRKRQVFFLLTACVEGEWRVS